MTARQQRMLIVILVLAGVGIATTFGLRAFQENLLYYYSPSAVQAGEAPMGRKFRVGGLVVPGSVTRQDGELEVGFDLTDNGAVVTVVTPLFVLEQDTTLVVVSRVSFFSATAFLSKSTE